MASKIEPILQFVGEYHAFCNQKVEEQAPASENDQELSVVELELIAAAAHAPATIPQKDKKET